MNSNARFQRGQPHGRDWISAGAGLLLAGLLMAGCERKAPAPGTPAPPPPPATNAAGGAAAPTTNAAVAGTAPTNAAPQVAGAVAPGQAPGPGGAPVPGVPPAPPGASGVSTNEALPTEIQVSFQGANVDMIVQWLAKTTGKSVVKHPRVQCQLTIVSSKKVSTREAIDLVYRALALEGFNAVETSGAILILPEGQDAKLPPEILSSSHTSIPEGRQRLLRIFPLTRVAAAELRDKVRAVLSEKGSIDVDERANALMVTDYNDNLRLVSEMIRELDVTSIGDAVVEVISLKFADAEEVANLVGLILNAQSPGSAMAGRSPGGSSGGSASPPPGMPGMPPGMSGGGGGSGGGGAGGASGSGSSLQVRMWPDKSANRLIVATPKSKLEEVRKLIEILDTDKPDDFTVRTLPLKHVQAMDLVKEVQPLYQKLGARSQKETVEIAANDRSNSLIVLSSEANFRSVAKFVASLDTEDALEKITRTFPLKHADAQDVAKQLEQLGQSGEDPNSRFRYYFFSSEQQSSRKKMAVVADRRRNSIVVQAPPAQMPSIEKMIAELDEPVGDDSLAPRIYQLKFVSAVDIEDVLNELFLKKQTRNVPYWYFDDSDQQQTPDRDVGRLYGKVRITSEPYSNTIIVTSNSKENLAVVEDILKQLDIPSQAGETTLRIPLRFAKAAVLSDTLNILFAKNGSPPLRQNPQQPQQNQGQQPNQQQGTGPRDASFELGQEAKDEGYFPWLGGQPDNPRGTDGRTSTRQVSDLVARVRIVADQRSNALLVSANMHLLPQIMKLVEEMDAPTAQVLIEARIIEVSTDKFDKLGVRWSPDGSKVFTAEDYDGSILGSGRSRYQQGFGGQTAVNTPGLGSVAQTLTQLRSGLLDASVNLDVLVQFLRKNTEATVLAEPQINVSDNEMGRLFVGQQVPFINSSQNTINGLVQGFDYKSVGIILEVTPHINTSGDVALRIRAESSGIQPGQTLFGGAILDTRNFRTDVTAKSGETLVLGGIIQKQVSDTVRRVPVLGDIPGLGWAFKKKDKTARNVELMVFLRPKITRTPDEARALLQDLDRKAPLLKAWREDVTAKAETDAKESSKAEAEKEKEKGRE